MYFACFRYWTTKWPAVKAVSAFTQQSRLFHLLKGESWFGDERSHQNSLQKEIFHPTLEHHVVSNYHVPNADFLTGDGIEEEAGFATKKGMGLGG